MPSTHLPRQVPTPQLPSPACKAGLLSLSAPDTGVRAFSAVRGRPVHSRMSSSIPGLHPPEAGSTPSAPHSHDNQKCLHITWGVRLRTTSLDVNLLLVWGYISVGSLWGESWVTSGECGVHLSSLQSVSREKDRPERGRYSCLHHPAVSDTLPHGAALRSRDVGKIPSPRAPQWGSLLPNSFFSRWRLNSPPGNWASEAPFLPPCASHGGTTITASGPPICAPTCVPLVSIPTTPYTLDTQIHLCSGTDTAVKFWAICFTSLSFCPASVKGGARTSTQEARQVGVRPRAGSQLPL